MKRIIYIIGLIGSWMLSGCQSEMPLAEDADNNGSAQRAEVIEIVGGKPSGLGLESRAETSGEPSQMGICNADRLQIWVYSGLGSRDITGRHTPTLAELKNRIEFDPIVLSRYSGDNSENKVTTKETDARRDEDKRWGCAIPALAYSEKDKGNEYFSFSSPENVSNMTFSLNELIGKDKYHVPEVYFGYLKLSAKDTKNDNKEMITEEGIISYLGYLASTNKTYQREFNNTPIHGKIYRIVSQLNISVTEVDESKLESMDLLVSNFPQSIKLYGNHGEYYPIEAATKDNHIESKEYVQIGHTKDFKRKKIMVTLKDEQGNPLKDENGREKQVETYTVSADLSSFLLPSELGRKVRVRLNYKPGTLVDDEGNVLENQSVEYDIRPSKDYLLSLENSEVYKSGVTTAKDDEGTKVVIYDHINDAFYSVANVKVNISGKFEKIFAEVSEVDVNIEVCPAFEASHEYDF